MEEARYPERARAVHWATAGLIALQACLGLTMETLGQVVYLAHMGVGILILTLSLARLGIRRATRDWPEAHGGWPAKVGHGALYALIIVTPLAGLAAAATPWHALDEAHEWCAFALLGLVGGHVGMVAYHKYMNKINLLPRMF